MKTAAESEYVLVDAIGEEDPTYLVYQNTTDHKGLPISPNDYQIAVSALNWVGEGQKSDPLSFTVPYLVSQSDTQISGSAIDDKKIEGAVLTTVYATAKDENSVSKSIGGDKFFLHVENTCVVTDNYRCDESSAHSEFADLPLFLEMTDNNDGSYSADFVIHRDGFITVSVVLARKGGLYAEYFNNAFLSGVPSVADKVDNVMKFDWGYDSLTPESGDFVSIHWYGKILAPTTEDFTFILSGDDGFRMYLDGVLLIDRWNWCCDDMTVTVALVEGTFYDLVLEYKEL
jgi:hypothetical protein